MKLAVLASSLLLTGCQAYGLIASHTSHPLVGVPFNSTPEGDANEIGVFVTKKIGKWEIESQLTWDTTYRPESSLLGGPFIYRGQIKYNLTKER